MEISVQKNNYNSTLMLGIYKRPIPKFVDKNSWYSSNFICPHVNINTKLKYQVLFFVKK